MHVVRLYICIYMHAQHFKLRVKCSNSQIAYSRIIRGAGARGAGGGGLFEHNNAGPTASISLGDARSPIIYISSKLPDDSGTDGPGTTL